MAFIDLDSLLMFFIRLIFMSGWLSWLEHKLDTLYICKATCLRINAQLLFVIEKMHDSPNVSSIIVFSWLEIIFF